MGRYVIRITRIRYETLEGKEEEEHYYRGGYDNKPVYRVTFSLDTATSITEQETRKVVKEIKLMYKENPRNGTLLKIEVVDVDTLNSIFTTEPEPETIISRFELMEL